MLEHINKDNMHHAYLIEAWFDSVEKEILASINNFGIITVGNPDFVTLKIDNFKIDDAKMLISLSFEKSTNLNKKVFLISIKNITLEAQNALLKIFEEPIPNVHYFLILPDRNILLETLLSRLFILEEKRGSNLEDKARSFVRMNKRQRIDFIKEIVKESKKEIEDSSARSRSAEFLNALEIVLKKDFGIKKLNPEIFTQIFQTRKFLREPGASPKTLLESVALLIPN